MKTNHQVNNDTPARTMSRGGWFWLDARVIRHHARSIGAMGIAVYNVLALMADSNQECYPSQKHIGKLLGYSRATVNKTLKALQQRGLILVEKSSPYRCTYRLLDLGCKAEETELSSGGNPDVPELHTNNNQITKINNDIVRVNKKNILSDSGQEEEFIPTTKEELLACDLAAALNEADNLSWYLYLAKRYPEGLLRRNLSETREVSSTGGVRKNLPALFNHLLKKHVQKNHNSPGDKPRDEIPGSGPLQEHRTA